ncbi:tRNA-guanine transglycosylase [bacterium]|nr:tRNA-guanine transglycosylase [bacterium]
MISSLTIKGQTYRLPVFCPDATRGVVRNLDSQDLQAAGIHGLIVNTWHLHQFPGAKRLIELGGIKKLMNYPELIISDSGGFQVFSLFQKVKNFGKITDEGLITYTGPKRLTKILFTPEDSIKMQFALGSDIMICLDDYTAPGSSPARVEESVARTIAWAKRCRSEFDRQCQLHGYTNNNRPLLFGVIQGHDDQEQRQRCAQQLLKIGFDGFGLGGQKFTTEGKLDLDWAAFNASLTPDNLPRYALGFGKPDEIIALFHQGYQIFDCVLPTRDARHGRLYISSKKENEVYQFLNINQGRFAQDHQPLDPKCHCHTCTHTNRAYLHHLFKIGDGSFYRLATIHNAHFFAEITNKLAENS